MAETLSVAASGIAVIQISSQVGVAVVKLKQLLDEVKDVPDDISDLLQQIDCLDPALWDADASLNDTNLPSILWNDQAARRSTVYCQQALKDLTALVDELSVQINDRSKVRKKLASVKAVLQKPTLKKLEKRLENAIRMLTLAQQGYLVALTKIQPDIIVQRFLALTVHEQASHPDKSPKTVPAWNDKSVDANSQREDFVQPNATAALSPLQRWRHASSLSTPFGRIALRSSARGSSLIIQPSSWLFKQSWDLQCYRASGDWQLNLRTYYARPSNSEVFRVVNSGSVQDLQRMFDMGLASPFDYDEESSNTLLHLAARRQNIYACKSSMFLFLVDKGLDMLAPDYFGRTALESFVVLSDTFDKTFDRPKIVDEAIALRQMEYHSRRQGDEAFCTCTWGRHYPELYTLMRYRICPSHDYTTVESRIQSVVRWIKNPIVFKEVLQPEWTSDLIGLCRISVECGTSLPVILATEAAWAYILSKAAEDASLFGWFTLLTEIVSEAGGGKASYEMSNSGQSCSFLALLFYLLFNHSNYLGRHLLSKDTVEFLRACVTNLKGGGIDLIEFGNREAGWFLDEATESGREFYADRNILISRRWRADYLELMDVSVRLIGLKYGPRPEDWDVYWSEPTDGFVGHFWRLIEDPTLHVPGAWEEIFDD